MAENVEFEINGKDTSDGVLSGVSDNLASVQEHVQELAQALKATDKYLESAQKNLSGVSGEAREAADALKKANSDAGDSAEWKELSAYLKDAQDNYRDLGREAVIAGGQAKEALAAFSALDKTEIKRIATGENPNLLGDIRAEEKANAQATAQAVKQAQIRNTEETKWSNKTREIELANLQAVIRARATANDRAVAQAKERAIAEQAGAKVSRAGELAAFKNQLISGTAEGTRFAGVTGEVAKQVNVAKKSLDSFDGSLANTRYALHDISMTMGMFGVATAAALGLGIKTIADYETSIANIQRTSEMSAGSAAVLRDEFVQLATEIPVAFNELGRIGELGGQLNVPAEQIAEFTKNVAMFGATTDVTVDAAATAFGRLDALLPDVQGNYAALGSSILKVGINSVATESEIISTTSQIAAAGAAAGMSADQVIGLSASFASLGVAPEAARGTVIRVLGLMNAAVAEGGDKLEAFASTAGISAKEFQDSWGTAQFTDSFIGFLTGIQSEGKSAQLALKDLGIWAARDQNNLLKLSQNTGTVVDIMGDAADGMNNAGFMAEQFGIKSETLNAKLQILANNFTNLIAQAGEISGGALGGIVDVINGILSAATKLVDNPLAQWMVTSYAAAVGLAAALALAGSGIGRVVASSLAIVPVKQQATMAIERLTTKYYENMRAAIANGTATTNLGLRMQAVAGMAGGLVAGLKGLGASVGIGAAIGAIAWGVSQLGEAMKSNTDKAAEAFGSFDTLVQASAQDAAKAIETYGSVANAVANTSSGYKEVTVELDKGSGAFSRSKASADAAAQAQDNMANATGKATGAIQTQTILLGENAQAAMLDAILANDKMAESMLRLEANSFDLNAYLENLSTGNLDAATAQLDAFYQKTITNTEGTRAAGMEVNRFEGEINELRNALDLSEGALNNLAIQQQFAAVTGREMGGVAGDAGNAFEDVDDAATALDNTLEQLSGEFDFLKTSAQLGESMGSLIDAMGNGAIAADLMGGSVIQNVSTIQSAVEQSIKAGASYGYTAVESVSALFSQLQQQGVNTAALLSSLSKFGMKSLGGISLGTIEKQMSNLGTNTSQLSTYFGGLANATRDAGAATKGAGKNMDDTAESAKNLKEEVYTLTDYASDLASVWTRAFDIRFGAQQAQDTITSTFAEIRKRIQDATVRANEFKLKIRELKAEGQSLNSDRNITAYFLRIANSYKDTLRAGELSAKLAGIDADIAKNKLDVAKASQDQKKAQDDASTSLKGNSEQSIKNRATITQLIQEYQKKIEKLASAGLSEQQLAIETEKLRKDFVKQATQLGFNRRELELYARSFGDVRAAIANIPRNITIKANANPALQALAEFAARAKNQMSNAGTNAKNAFNSAISGIGSNVPQLLPPSKPDMTRAFPYPYGSWGSFMGAMRARVGSNFLLLPAPWNQLAFLGSSMGYASGGYTGRGAKDDPAGIVHRGEFVVPKVGVNQSTGLPDPGWMNRNIMNTDPGANSGARINSMSSGGTGTQRVFVINAVELGIQSLHAMNNMGGSEVMIGDNAIARAASASNVKNNQNGAS